MTAEGIAGAVRGRTRSASEVVAAALERLTALDPALNAFTTVLAERALARAARIDRIVADGDDPGPLAGVPFAAKNLFDVAGIVTRAGSRVTAGDAPATRDAGAIAAWERAGAILIGATNMDEFAYGFTTENAYDGPTANPHDLTRVAGGSSGGSGAAVGAGIVPLALGSDTNGSIRVPAANCGIFGLRPTFGTVSRAGAYPFVNSLDTIGPFARTAGDLALAFAALCPTAASTARTAPLRVARLGGYFDAGCVPAARAAVDRVARALGVAGPPLVIAAAQHAREAAFIMTGAEAGELHAARLRDRYDDFDPATRDRLLAGALMPAQWYVRARRFRSVFRALVREVFARYDVLLAPATPYPATKIGQTTIVIDGVATEVRANVGVFTQPITLAGVTVVTVPVVEPGALPVGVQLIGRPNDEAIVIDVAAQLERAGVVGAGALPVQR
jgi:AtzE family amidohydrolase